jgi:hypothetical protein
MVLHWHEAWFAAVREAGSRAACLHSISAEVLVTYLDKERRPLQGVTGQKHTCFGGNGVGARDGR